jgi:aspartate kinase
MEGNMKPIVMKFGGTSVGSPEAICRSAGLAADQARKEPGGVVVVVSALSGVTNMLIAGAQQAACAPWEQIEWSLQAFYDRHVEMISALHLNPTDEANLLIELAARVTELRKVFTAVHLAGKLEPAQQDAAAALGERICAPIFAALLRRDRIKAMAVDARQLIVTDAEFTHANVDFELSRAKILEYLPAILAQGIVPVVTGFIGATPSGQVTTLGRGASDYTSTILGAALGAREIWNWTDVDGVMTADPRAVDYADVIPLLSYAEMGIMAGYGAKVLHPETVRPVARLGIPLRVRNSFNANAPGTLIQGEQPVRNGKPLAIACQPGLTLVEVSNGINLGDLEPPDYQLIPADGRFQVCLAYKLENAGNLGNLSANRCISIVSNVCLVTVVGGIKHIARIEKILERYKLNPLGLRLSYSDGCISLAVQDEDSALVVRIMYDDLIVHEPIGVWFETAKVLSSDNANP